eukprot:TRINITY_DN25014_c0_g1_i1.p1 TRINITY_DN25014_c0_g1~~TRINITY_DN25014_c0_g1_i1.p1  ORF type:complete len:149 (-),score=1.33 TRINITY_DN25014_c0_g1_i1:37-483(-)
MATYLCCTSFHCSPFLFTVSVLVLSVRILRKFFDKWLSRVNSQKFHRVGLHVTIEPHMDEIKFQVWPPPQRAIIHTLFIFPFAIGDRLYVQDFINPNLLNRIEREHIERLVVRINKLFPSFIKIILFGLLYGIVWPIGLIFILSLIHI